MGTLRTGARIVIAIDLLFFMLLGFSFLYIEPGTGSYVAAQLTLLPTVLSFLAAVSILYSGWDPF
jgi:hypothetical protein